MPFNSKTKNITKLIKSQQFFNLLIIGKQLTAKQILARFKIKKSTLERWITKLSKGNTKIRLNRITDKYGILIKSNQGIISKLSNDSKNVILTPKLNKNNEIEVIHENGRVGHVSFQHVPVDIKGFERCSKIEGDRIMTIFKPTKMWLKEKVKIFKAQHQEKLANEIRPYQKNINQKEINKSHYSKRINNVF